MIFSIPFNNNYPWYIIFELSFLQEIDIEKELDLILEKASQKNIFLMQLNHKISQKIIFGKLENG